MVHRINMLLNSSSTVDEDEIIISEITDLKKSFGNNNNSNNNNSNINYFEQDEDEENELLHSPKKLRSSTPSTVTVTSPITVSNILNNNNNTYNQPTTKDYCEMISTLKKLNTNQHNSPQKTSTMPMTPVNLLTNINQHSSSSSSSSPSHSMMSKSQSMGSMNHYLNRFEKSEQEVADFDSDDEFCDDEDDEFCDDEDDDNFVFTSRFDEMKTSSVQNNNGNASNNSTPTTSPKSNAGTPSRPFPTLDYKIKSESVKQNPDGTYSCPYPNCNKTIKGNKGNLSSHLRWHRRLDAEAGEARGTNPCDEGEEEFTTPSKPSQRGVQLRNQMIHYGLNLFRLDSQGKYLCFFEGCSLRMLTNFSRHIAKHERKNDKIKEELVPFLPAHHIHGSSSSTSSCSTGNTPSIQSMNINSNGKRSNTLSMSSPSSPTSASSNRYASVSPFSPILSNSCSSIPMIESSPLHSSSNNYISNQQQQQQQSHESSRLKRKLSVNVKFNTPMHTSSTISHPSTPSIHSYPYSAPCTPTTSSSTPIGIMNNINNNNNGNNSYKCNILSPRSLSSPSFTSLYDSDFRKGKLDSIISSDNDFAVPSSSPSCSPHKRSTGNNNSINFNNTLSPLSPTTSCVPTNSSGRFQLPQVSLFKDIQWDYNRSQLQQQSQSSSCSNSTNTTPKKTSTLPSSSPSFHSLSPLSPSSSSSIVPFTFTPSSNNSSSVSLLNNININHKFDNNSTISILNNINNNLRPHRSREDEVAVKSLIDLGQFCSNN